MYPHLASERHCFFDRVLRVNAGCLYLERQQFRSVLQLYMMEDV